MRKILHMIIMYFPDRVILLAKAVCISDDIESLNSNCARALLLFAPSCVSCATYFP